MIYTFNTSLLLRSHYIPLETRLEHWFLPHSTLAFASRATARTPARVNSTARVRRQITKHGYVNHLPADSWCPAAPSSISSWRPATARKPSRLSVFPFLHFVILPSRQHPRPNRQRSESRSSVAPGPFDYRNTSASRSSAWTRQHTSRQKNLYRVYALRLSPTRT